MKSNYDKMADEAARLFLKQDQEAMIRKWGLDADDTAIYVPFFSENNTLRIDRKSALVYKICDGLCQTEPQERLNWEAMAVYDLLTYGKGRPAAAGEWVSVSELGGVIGIRHETGLTSPLSAQYASRMTDLAAACEKAGGIPDHTGKGDLNYAFRVFKDFGICLRFWDEDDEFPAQTRFFFDRNALQFMHYETLWYVMNILEKRIIDADRA